MSENILTNTGDGVTINSTKEKRKLLKTLGGYSNEIVILPTKI